MGDNTGIEWTDASWTPIRARNRATGKVGWHCTHASDGCRHCYAEGMNHRLGTGLPFKPGHEKDVEIYLDEAMLLQPLRWKRPRMIFVCSMTDLFADFVPDDWIDKIFALMALTPQHTFQVLTKRSKRMRKYFAETWQLPARPAMRIDSQLTVPAAPTRTEDRWGIINGAIDDVSSDPLFEQNRFWTPDGNLIGRPAWPRRPLPNVWLGVSAEDQARAAERIPDLLATPAAVRFVSAEPLLGPIYIPEYMPNPLWNGLPSWKQPEIDWVIAGGESGPHARPMHPDWARSLRDQCATAGVPFFFKQWGEWSPVEIVDEDEDGQLGPAYPLPDCSAPATHKAEQECLFWQGDALVHWPKIETVPAIGARRVGKRAAGRLLDGREHNDMPKEIA